MKKDKPYDRTVFQAFTMILQFGINMVVPIAMMTALGIWLDRKFDTGYFTVILFFVGALAGGQNIYRMAKQIFRSPDERQKENACLHEKNNNRQGRKDDDSRV